MNSRLKNQKFFMGFNRIIFPLFYLRYLRRKTAIVAVEKGTRFQVRVNTSDILLVWEIWKLKVYEDDRWPIRATDTVVDIGAHIGVFAVRAARQARRGIVFAYEAAKENFDCLSRNLQLNNVRNVQAENMAIFDRSGEFDFYLPGSNGALGSFMQEHGSARERVSAVTLDEVVSRNSLDQIDFLKMDAEGAEYPILLACSADTLRKIRYMILEYHEFEGVPWGPTDLKSHLQSHGFTVSIEAGIFPQKHLFGTGIIKAWRPGSEPSSIES